MTSSLTKREKFLIFTAVYAAISFLMFQFVIMSAYNYYQAQTERNQALSAEKATIVAKIDAEDNYINQNKQRHAELDEIMAIYPQTMRNEKVDDILTGLCVSSGLEPISLSLSKVEDAESSGNTGSAESSGNADEETKDDAQTQSAFTVVEAKMTTNGSIDQLLRLIKQVKTMEFIRISRLSFQNNRDSENLTDCNITLYFNVTMLNELQ